MLDALDLQVDCKPYRARVITVNARNLRATAAGLFLLTAALFGLGVNRERAGHHVEATARTAVSATVAATETPGETGAETAGETGSTASSSGSETTATSSGSERSEKVLGLNLESPGSVVVAVIASLTVAGGLLLRRSSLSAIAGTAVVVGLVFAVVDVAEVAHQHHVGRNGLAALAGLVAVGHVLAGALCAWSLRSRRAVAAATG